jgi:antitoxin MazE
MSNCLRRPRCRDYRNYMTTHELTICQIGNSRGIRLPAGVLKKYGLNRLVILEEKPDELILRPVREKKLSWSETFQEMAKEREDWSHLETTTGDGLRDL